MKNNIGSHLTKRALLNPNREAIVDIAANKRFTYTEANARSNRVANAMTAGGLVKGDRVATLLMNGPSSSRRSSGSARSAASSSRSTGGSSPTSSRSSSPTAVPTTLVFGTAFNEVVRRAPRARRRRHPGHPLDPRRRRRRPPDFAERLRGPCWPPPATTNPRSSAGDDDLLFIMYTSGTTGLPKGVMHSHNTTLWSVDHRAAPPPTCARATAT